MLQLVIKDGIVIATHSQEQNLQGLYPESEIVIWDKPFPVLGEGELFQLDPRTEEDKLDSYRDKRRLEYPLIREQLDMIYWDTLNGTRNWVDTITAIKEKYPKPTS